MPWLSAILASASSSTLLLRGCLLSACALNGLFQFLGRPERNLLAGLDLDGLASRRVPSHPGGPLPHLEDAETGQTDFGALLQMAGGQRHQIAEHGLSLFLRDLMAVCQRGGEVLECDRRLCGSFRWGGFLCAAFFAGGMTISCGRMTNGWSECRRRSDSLKCTVSPQWPSGAGRHRRQLRGVSGISLTAQNRPQPRRRKMPDFRAACSYSAHAIADLRLAEVIQGQRAADATTPMASGGELVLSKKGRFQGRGDFYPKVAPGLWGVRVVRVAVTPFQEPLHDPLRQFVVGQIGEGAMCRYRSSQCTGFT